MNADIILDIDRHNVLNSFAMTESYNGSVQEVADIFADSLKYQKSEQPSVSSENIIIQYTEEITAVIQVCTVRLSQVYLVGCVRTNV